MIPFPRTYILNGASIRRVGAPKSLADTTNKRPTQPENVMSVSTRKNQFGSGVLRRRSQAPIHAVASIAMPVPTIIRKAQKTGATGGCSPSNSFSPFTSPFRSCVKSNDANSKRIALCFGSNTEEEDDDDDDDGTLILVMLNVSQCFGLWQQSMTS